MGSDAAEPFFSTLEHERISRCLYITGDQARLDIATWINIWYNKKCFHTTDNMTSPIDYEHVHQPQTTLQGKEEAHGKEPAMTMTTPIATFEDILTAMENDPSLREAMRQHILDQEFLQLPVMMKELKQVVAQLAETVQDHMATTNIRLERLEAGQARLEEKVNRLQTGQARLEGNVNRLIGSDYERKAARRASRLIQRHLGVSSVGVIYAITTPDDNRLSELLDQAINTGSVTTDEADEIENTDLVLNGPDSYIVAEVSVTLDNEDIRRAQKRASLLAQATAEPVKAAAIGAHALDTAIASAAEHDVTIIILPR